MKLQANKPPRRVLVVDDEAIIAETVSTILKLNGYQTRSAHSGEEAIAIASDFRPELLITDIVMPGIDGLETAARIVSLLPDCQVLLISGNLNLVTVGDERVRSTRMEALAKPVPPNLLLQKVGAMLAARERRPITIVNVDDAEIARYSVTHILRRAGFEVRGAGTGSEALELAKTGPDLILLDIHLPDMTGFEVCRRLRAAPETARIPIIHLTNTCRDEESRKLALSLGANEYLTQPVEPGPLVSLVRRLSAAA